MDSSQCQKAPPPPSGSGTAYQQGHTGQSLAPRPQFGKEGHQGQRPLLPHMWRWGSSQQTQHGNTVLVRTAVAANQQGNTPEVFLASATTPTDWRIQSRIWLWGRAGVDHLIVTLRREAQIKLNLSLLGHRRAREDGSDKVRFMSWTLRAQIRFELMNVLVIQRKDISLLLNIGYQQVENRIKSFTEGCGAQDKRLSVWTT